MDGTAAGNHVHERISAESRLRESEQRFRDFASAAADWWFWEMDSDLRFTYFSENVTFGTGRDVKDILGKRRRDIAAPADAAEREKWDRHFDDLAHRRVIKQFEYCQLGIDGEPRWISVSGVPVFGPDGAFQGYRGTGTDITARKRAEESRARSERILRAAIDAIDEGFALYDEQDRLVYCNEKYRQIYAISADLLVPGVSFEEIIRKGAERGQYSAAVGRIDEWVKERMDAHRSGESRFEQRLDDGRWLRIVEARTQDGYTVGFRVDITELKEKEIALRRSEEKYRLLAENASDWIYSIDTKGRSLYHSPACEEITGYSPKEFLDDPGLLARIVHPEDGEIFACHLTGGDAAHDLMYRIIRRDGTERWVAHLCQPMFDDAGRVLGRRAANRDITERKRIGMELDRHRQNLEELVAQRTAQLEAANRAKSAFLANMSHEIRTPMNAIVSLSQLAEQRSQDPAQKALLQKVTAAAGHLLGIVKDILDISKIEAGKMTLDHADFDLREAIEETVQIFVDQAAAKGLSLTTQMSPALPEEVRGDRARLGQVLINLLGNAVKFTEHGSVTVRVQPDDGTDGPVIRFEVIDTGIGIEPGTCVRLFESFEQADATTTRRYGGTGLGLAISRTLVQLMGGHIGVESEPGRGSRFWFTAWLEPRRDGDDHKREAGENQDAASVLHTRLALRHRGRRVMVVEDNALNRDVLAEVLRGTGLLLDMAADGQQALDLARQQRCDVVLMDVQMPVMDGLAAAKALRKLPGWAEVPIIAVTANAFEDDRQRCREAGMNDFLAKPIRPDTLLRTLLKWLPAAPAQPRPLGGESARPAVPMEDEPPFLGALRSIPGLDVRCGLESLRGKATSYARMLGVYAATHRHDMEEIRRRLAAGEIAEARRLAHSLKGASATLGVSAVQVRARDLEQALKAILEGGNADPEGIEALISAVEEAQTPLIRALAEILPPV